MSTNQPLAYQTSKAVLLYLNANLRLELAQKCSEIRTADMSTPLKIENLQLSPMDFQVNDTTYGVTLHRVPRRTEYFPEYPHDNSNCEEIYDVDHYGFKDQSVGPEDSFFWDYVAFSYDYESDLDIVLKKHSLTHADLSESAEKIRSDISLSKKPDMSKLQFLFDRNNQVLFPYILRHMGMEPHEMPYYYCIGFNVNDGEKTELVDYTCKLVDAVRYMFNKVFGNRKLIIAKKLEISAFCCFRYKFQSHFIVSDLKISDDYSKVLNEFGPLLNSNEQQTLQSLQIVVPEGNNGLDHAIIKSAEVLTVEGDLSNEQLQQLSTTNRRVIFDDDEYQDEILFLVGEWKRNTPPIGTHYSFPLFDDHFHYAFDDIRQLEGSSERLYPETRETKFPHCITFKLSNESELNVYYEQEYIHMKIDPAGHSVPL